jgi:preprotein translocase subunit SecG
MKNSKKVFIFLAIIFFIILLFLSWDISRRTTFPGSRPQLKERLEKQYREELDSLRDKARDTVEVRE